MRVCSPQYSSSVLSYVLVWYVYSSPSSLGLLPYLSASPDAFVCIYLETFNLNFWLVSVTSLTIAVCLGVIPLLSLCQFCLCIASRRTLRIAGRLAAIGPLFEADVA